MKIIILSWIWRNDASDLEPEKVDIFEREVDLLILKNHGLYTKAAEIELMIYPKDQRSFLKLFLEKWQLVKIPPFRFQ